MPNRRLIELIKWHALSYGDYTLASGRKSNYYIDMRKLTLLSEGLQIISDEIIRILPLDYNAIGGLSIGADPIIGGVLARTEYKNLRGFLVRKEDKGHGLGGRILGSLRRGDNVVIVDDVITTGGSVLEAARAVEEYGCSVVKVITILDRLEGHTLLYEHEALLTIKDVLT